jgi:hypothetical protein
VSVVLGEPLGSCHRGVSSHERLIHGLNAIDNQPTERHVFFAKPLDEIGSFAQRIRFGCRDNEESRAPILKEREGLVGPLAKTTEGCVDCRDEGAHIREYLCAEDLAQNASEDSKACGSQPTKPATSSARRGGEDADEPAIKERSQACRRIKEIERTARWRGIDHDQVPGRILLCAELAEFLHGHVFLSSSKRRRQRLVKRIGQDLLCPIRIGVRFDYLIEGALHVEHHRVQGTWAGDAWNRSWGVIEFGQTHSLGKPASWVDGQHTHVSATLGRTKCQCGGACGLADSTGARAYQDRHGWVVEQ